MNTGQMLYFVSNILFAFTSIRLFLFLHETATNKNGLTDKIFLTQAWVHMNMWSKGRQRVQYFCQKI
jgi:hypothetical protein